MDSSRDITFQHDVKKVKLNDKLKFNFKLNSQRDMNSGLNTDRNISSIDSKNYIMNQNYMNSSRSNLNSARQPELEQPVRSQRSNKRGK